MSTRSPRFSARLLAIHTAVAALAACAPIGTGTSPAGDGGATGDVDGGGGSRDAGFEAAAETIGDQGGTVTTESGAAVDVPAGALAEDTAVTVESAPDEAPPPATDAVGTPYVLGPEGLQFAVPVEVAFPVDLALLTGGATLQDVVVYTAPLGTTDWEPLPTTVLDATHVVATTTHFSVFVPVVAQTPACLVTCTAWTSAAPDPGGTPPGAFLEPPQSGTTSGCECRSTCDAVEYQVFCSAEQQGGTALCGCYEGGQTTGASTSLVCDGTLNAAHAYRDTCAFPGESECSFSCWEGASETCAAGSSSCATTYAAACSGRCDFEEMHLRCESGAEPGGPATCTCTQTGGATSTFTGTTPATHDELAAFAVQYTQGCGFAGTYLVPGGDGTDPGVDPTDPGARPDGGSADGAPDAGGPPDPGAHDAGDSGANDAGDPGAHDAGDPGGGNQPPMVHILRPGDGLELPSGMSTTLEAHAADPETGDLPASNVRWFDEGVQIFIGPGPHAWFPADGVHHLEVRARDPELVEAVATATIYVGVAAPVVDAGPCGRESTIDVGHCMVSDHCGAVPYAVNCDVASGTCTCRTSGQITGSGPYEAQCTSDGEPYWTTLCGFP